jgi:hypothetical protein
VQRVFFWIKNGNRKPQHWRGFRFISSWERRFARGAGLYFGQVGFQELSATSDF